MEAKQILPLFLFFLVLGLASSNEMQQTHGSFGRSLLQQKTPCQVDFENMNYTVMTSQCKGPNYSTERCCSPLKDLICPIRDDFNNLQTTCADSFFSYLNLYGKYPPGLFAALCKETREGLDCENVKVKESPSSHASARSPLTLIMYVVFLVIMVHFRIIDD